MKTILDIIIPDDLFKKSSWSKNNPKTCVEIAQVPEGVAIRDSKNPRGPQLRFSHEEWKAFVGGVKGGEFDSKE